MNSTSTNPPNPLSARTSQPLRHRRGLVIRGLMVLSFGYVAILLLLVAFETRLVYPGRPYPVGNWEPKFAREEIEFTSADGTSLSGWMLPRENAVRTVLVFHGNAENVATTSANYGHQLRQTLQADVFVFDYRGFGKSDGSPHEQAVIADGIAALDWLSQRTGKSASEIIFYGRSLGGGVALGVAELHPPQMLILDRTFDSLISPAANRFPWIPVSWLMRNRFPSDQRIRNLDCPIWITHFVNDELIPIKFARNLYAQISHPKKDLWEIPGGDHLAALPRDYWRRLREFVEQNEGAAPGFANGSVLQDPPPASAPQGFLGNESK